MSVSNEATIGSSSRLSPLAGSVLSRTLFKAMLVLAALLLAALLMLKFLDSELARSGRPGDTGLRRIDIGNEVLMVPGNLIRFSTQRRSGYADRLDLHFRWPGLQGYEEISREAFDGETVNPAIVFAAIEPQRMRLDMSDRVGPLYSKFLEGAEEDAGYGLKKRQLSDRAGFLDEDLYYQTGSSHPFAARCIRAGTRYATPYCLRDIHIGKDLMVTYRFHLSLIGNWMMLDGAIRERIRAMLLQ